MIYITYIIGSAVATYLLFLLAVGLLKNKLIFPAPKPFYTKAPMTIQLANKESIAAVWLPSDKSKLTMLYSHGNGEDIGEIAETLKRFNQSGFSVLSYDYIGYGQSKGKPSEEKIYLAADAAWNFLTKEKNIAPENIAIVGYSLGSAAAAHLAKEHPDARCLILSGGFSEGINAINPIKIYPFEILNNTKKLEANKLPALIVHARNDRIVPPRNAKKNYATLTSKKRLYWLEYAHHTNMVEFENYFDEIVKFINNPNL